MLPFDRTGSFDDLWIALYEEAVFDGTGGTFWPAQVISSLTVDACAARPPSYS